MKNILSTIAQCMLGFCILFCAAQAKAQSDIWVTAYYAGWQQGTLPPQSIDYGALTHICHFALVPNSNGTLNDQSNSVSASSASALISAAHAAGKKVLITVGGWGTESAFMSATGSGTRPAFVSNLVSLMRTRGYDGIDIDWEPLNSGDAANYTAFVTDLRNALNAVTPRPLLTMATQWTAPISASVASQMDQINLMTYDLAGAWPGWVVWHNSATLDGGVTIGSQTISCDGFVNKWNGAGVPLAKLGIGIDFYGYVWSGGAGTSTGGATAPGQSWTTAPSVQGNVPYSTIMSSYYQPGYYRWSANAQASYLSIDNAGSSADKFISYDDEATCTAKINYARNKHIGGVIIWELGGGYRTSMPSGQRDLLLQAVKQALGGGSTPTLPAVPSLASPLNNATGVALNPALSWNASTGAASYGIQVSTSSSFSSSVINQSGITGTSYPASGMVNGTLYYWRVNAANSAGTSAWSAANVFTTLTGTPAVPPAPSLASPANGATGVAVNPALSWNASTGAASYQVQVSTSSAFTSTIVNQSGITTTSYGASGLSNSTTYYWRANASNSGGTSPWSGVSSFVTSGTVSTRPNIALGKPATASSIENSSYPASYAFDGNKSTRWSSQYADPQWLSVDLGSIHTIDSVVINWEVAYGKSYSIQTSLDGATWTPAYSTASGTTGVNVIRIAPTSTRFVRMVGTQRGTAWGYSIYEMEAYDAVGTPPAAPPAAPVLASPANGATGVSTSPTVSWFASAGAASYRLQISPGSTFSTLTADRSGITGTSFAQSGLANATAYYWRMSATNSGGTSGWSQVSSFSTVAPVSGPDTAHPSVTFTAPTGGATVSGTLNLSANATDNVGVVGVQFKLDGTNAAGEVTAAPFTASWNSTSATNGSHTLSATARDAAGNQSTASITVTVSNMVSSSSDLWVYQEALQSPWVNNSWNATPTFNSIEQHYAGSNSIKVVQGAWGGLSLHSGNWGSSTGVNTSGYQSVECAIFGGPSGMTLAVMFENDAANSFPKISYGTIPANTWKVVSIPVGQLNPNNYVIHRLDIMEMSGTSRTYYVDNIRLVALSVAAAETRANGSESMPKAYALLQNYPNPFNPATTIGFEIPFSSHVVLKIYDVTGREVRTLVDEERSSGSHTIVWDGKDETGRNVASGTYIYRMTAVPSSGEAGKEFSAIRKLMLMK